MSALLTTKRRRPVDITPAEAVEKLAEIEASTRARRRRAYLEFIRSKVPKAERAGFEPLSECHESLKPHQRDLCYWAVRGGRRAVFAQFGLGKTRINLQIAKWVVEFSSLEGSGFRSQDSGADSSPSALTPSKTAQGSEERDTGPRIGGTPTAGQSVFHKTRFLIIAPLGVRQEFTKSDGPAMGIDVIFCRTDEQIEATPTDAIIITNYESVRDGKITVDRFAGAGLDEASVLRSFGSKTYHTFLGLFKDVPFRFVFTATPSPNRYKELIHYGGFLGVMDTGEALTRFFQRNSEQANDLTLYPHMEDQFWNWLASWAAFVQSPADLGYDATGYDLPDMEVIWHEIPVDHKEAWKQVDSWGQSQLFQDDSSGLAQSAEVKRSSIEGRIQKASEIIRKDSGSGIQDSASETSEESALNPESRTLAPSSKWLLWHDLEAERRAIEKHFGPGVVSTVYGSQDLDLREKRIIDFGNGEGPPILATKPVIAGSGCNFQRHCHRAIFLGVGYKFNDFIQAIHRIYRFLQVEKVEIHIIHTESERPIVEQLKAKWRRHNELVDRMSELIRKRGLLSLKEGKDSGVGE